MITFNIRRRLRFALCTLSMAAVVLMGCIIGTLLTAPSVPTSADGGKQIVYSISYNGLSNEAALERLASDIEYIRSRGLRFLLPSELNTVTEGGMVLIIELRAGDDVDAILSLLRKQGACAVMAAGNDCPSSVLETVLGASAEDVSEMAYIFETCSSEPVEMIAAFAEARLECIRMFGRESGVYLHRCGEPLCARASITNEVFPENMFIFGYGNGVNVLALPCRGIVGRTRILRLPEWTIEDYFSSIAG